LHDIEHFENLLNVLQETLNLGQLFQSHYAQSKIQMVAIFKKNNFLAESKSLDIL